jgi:undecaprenyl-diphosphatase
VTLHLIQNFDFWALALLNQYAHQSRPFDALVYDLADSSLLQGGFFMAYFWWLWFRVDPRTTQNREGIVLALVGALVAVIFSRVLQIALPFHIRPLQDSSIHFIAPYNVNPETLNRWSSFPSDHAALFAALSVAIGTYRPLFGALAGAWTLVVICLPRMYLGFHYPSDIGGGIALGTAVMSVTLGFARGARWPQQIVRWESQRRTAFYCLAFLATYELTVLFYDVRALGVDGFHLAKTFVSASAAPSHLAAQIPAAHQ